MNFIWDKRYQIANKTVCHESATLLVILLSLSPLNDKKVSKFLLALSQEITSYEAIDSFEKIDTETIEKILEWKEKYLSTEEEEDSEWLQDRMKFVMAEKDQSYNTECRAKEGLLSKQFKFTGKQGSKRVIVYNHNQGRANNTKLLFIDLNKPKRLTICYVNHQVTNLKELKNNLQEMAYSKKPYFPRSVHIFNGKPYPKSQSFNYVNF